jgi:hypothetical protein
MRKDLATSHDVVTCAVCGRTLLRGEHPEVYLDSGSRRLVCELCTARAAHQGWIRESASLDVAPHGRERAERAPRRGRLLSMRSRLRRNEPAEDGAAEATLAPDEDVVPALHPEHQIHAVPTNGELKAVRAVELFNASEHPRTVAGVARSLGSPSVAVLPSGHGSVVAIVVAWELCWYRYDVDLAEATGGVRVAAQGYELSELAPQEQTANAAAQENGVLVLPAE